MQLFRKALCVLSHFTVLMEQWYVLLPLVCKSFQQHSWCSQNSASGIFFLGFFRFSHALTANTDWQGRKYNGIVLNSNVGNEDVDHTVQGRDKEVKGVRKWKLIKPERSLHVLNYASFSVCFSLYFDNGSYTVGIFPKSGIIKSYQ